MAKPDGHSRLVAFLQARNEDDWAWAETVLSDPTAGDLHGIARRMLREVEARRRIINNLETAATADTYGQPNKYMEGYTVAGDLAVRALAAVYADHPDYDPEWARE